MKKIAIIGGGASGFFSAINISENLSRTQTAAEINIFEATNNLLAKVLISGGGRCNITNGAENITQLLKSYPRGFKELREVFNVLDNIKTIEWFHNHGVKTKTEIDGRVFPISDNAETVYNVFIELSLKNRINIFRKHKLQSIETKDGKFNLQFEDKTFLADYVIISIGGSQRKSTYDFLEKLGHKIVKPIPSLFTFDIKDNFLKGLQGIAVKNVQISYKKETKKVSRKGDLLITHKGLSGPAILKVSAFAAKEINLQDYKFEVRINWLENEGYDVHFEQELKEKILEYARINSKKNIYSNCPFFKTIPSRLWTRFCEFSEINDTVKWGGLSKHCLNKLTSYLVNTTLKVEGKTSNKEEFVTCGGVALEEVNFRTMESKIISGLYFTGEVLNIDGITGGYNFQAAWSSGFIAAKAITDAILYKQQRAII